MPEAGERVELGGADLRADPARLSDEARSTGLFAADRHVLVRATGDDALAALKAYAETLDAGEAEGAAPVIVVAAKATDKSHSAKLLAKRPDSLVTLFQPLRPTELKAEVRALGDAAGVRLEPPAVEAIAEACEGDVRLAGSEVGKLTLYLDADPNAPKPATLADWEAVGAAREEAQTYALIDAALGGDGATLGRELAVMRTGGVSPVRAGILFQMRVAQLAQLADRWGGRGTAAEAVEAARRARLVFGGTAALGRQLDFWGRGRRIDRLVERTAELHRAMLRDSRAASLLFAATMTNIARAARG